MMDLRYLLLSARRLSAVGRCVVLEGFDSVPHTLGMCWLDERLDMREDAFGSENEQLIGDHCNAGPT